MLTVLVTSAAVFTVVTSDVVFTVVFADVSLSPIVHLFSNEKKVSRITIR